MNLPPEEVQLFYRLYWNVLAYANRSLNILPQLASWEDIRKHPREKVSELRDAFWTKPKLLEQFIAENPAGLSPEELRIVAGWRHHLKGDFYILRYLKSYAVFLSAGREPHLYGVLGLVDPIPDVFAGHPLPIYLETVLLPFRGRIVYDGLMKLYRLLFGGGIRSGLNETYRRLKEKEGIVEQLVSPETGEPEIRTSLARRRPAKPAPDWRPMLDEMVAQLEKARQTDTPLQGAAMGLLRATAQLARAAFAENAEEEVLGQMRSFRRALTRLENLLYEYEE